MLLIWDFDVDPILTANTNAVAAVVPDSNNILETPLLAVDQVICNCSNFPNTDEVLVPPLDDTPEIEDSLESTERTRGNLEDGQENGNYSDDEHWFSDESEGIELETLAYMKPVASTCRRLEG